jgi:signal peptidase II
MESAELSVNSTDARTLNGGKAAMFATVLGGVVGLDLVTKLFIQRSMNEYQQVNVIGDYVRLTYIHNPGAAFGIGLGDYSRFIFLVLSMVALAALAGMYWVTPARDKVRLVSIALICVARWAICSIASGYRRASSIFWISVSGSCAGRSSMSPTWP